MFDPVIVAQEGSAVTVGADCMFAYGCDLRSSDGHSVLDAGTRARLNPPSDLFVEDHVWIGIQCQVLKGVRIGRDSIVAAHSVVTKSIPAGVIAAGSPARVIREGVTWDRERI
jgi:acetyltransferase-like isoleucine patch superfamily enzyme